MFEAMGGEPTVTLRQCICIIWLKRTLGIFTLWFAVAFLTLFRCGPRHGGGGHEMDAHVDEPREEEAAGVLNYHVRKVRWRLGHGLYQGGRLSMAHGLGAYTFDDPHKTDRSAPQYLARQRQSRCAGR